MTPNGGRITIETADKWLDDRSAKERGLPPGQYVSVKRALNDVSLFVRRTPRSRRVKFFRSSADFPK